MSVKAMVSATVVRAIANGAGRFGVDPERLLRRLALDPHHLDDIDAWYPIDHVMSLWEQAAELTGDSAFGLHLAEATRVGTLDILDYALFASPTLGVAVERVSLYFRLFSGGTRLDYHVGRQWVRVSHRPSMAGVEITRHGSEFAIACALIHGQRATGKEWRPREVHFAHAEPHNTSEHERIFRAPVRFGQPESALIFDKAILDLPLIRADAKLCEILDRHARDLLARVPDIESTSDRVRRELTESIRGGVPAVEDTAEVLGLGPRTLQRRLHDEETTHYELVREVRQQLATRYLAETTVSIAEIAFILGFSQPSSFNRAFRRWTGTTPTEYRRSLTPMS